MFTYKWIIENFEVQNSDTLENIATKIKWKYLAYDENNVEIGSEYDTLILDEPDSQNFTHFQELTEEIVISWLQSKLSVEDLQTAIKMGYKQSHTIPVVPELPETILPPWN